jgi:hypothetical protein
VLSSDASVFLFVVVQPTDFFCIRADAGWPCLSHCKSIVVRDSIMSSCDVSSSVEVLNPFDPARLRLTQDFATNLGVKKALVTVPVRKPAKEWWVQVRPNEAHRIETCVVELKEDREMYLVDPSLWPELAGESTFSPRALFTTMNRQGVLFLWPARLPGSDGKLDNWGISALEAARRASGKWVRVVANMDLGAYDVYETQAQWPEPQWPAHSLSDLLTIGFKGRLIETPDHPVLKRLRGEA